MILISLIRFLKGVSWQDSSYYISLFFCFLIIVEMVWYFLLLYLVFWSAMKDIGCYEKGYWGILRNVFGVKH